MGDTIIGFDKDNDRSFLAKNSTKESQELQIVHISKNPNKEFYTRSYLTASEEYLNNSFQKLESIFHNFDNRYKAIISRPTWAWGGEIGVNEFGLAIGNDVIFSKEKIKNEGLLGMDILRLALHNNRTAKEALAFIINLIQTYGQIGNENYSTNSKHHNSFLIKDFSEGYLLETAGKNIAVEKVDSIKTISNSYSTEFKEKYEDKLSTFFTKGNNRQKFTTNYLSNKPLDLTSIKKLLRSHMTNSNQLNSGMKSICIHSGLMTKIETTSSFIVDYIGDKFIIWFTAAPHPCISLFKPLSFPINKDNFKFSDKNFCTKYSNAQRILSKKILNKYNLFLKEIKPIRDEVEEKLYQITYNKETNEIENNLMTNYDECLILERKYINQVMNILDISKQKLNQL